MPTPTDSVIVPLSEEEILAAYDAASKLKGYELAPFDVSDRSEEEDVGLIVITPAMGSPINTERSEADGPLPPRHGQAPVPHLVAPEDAPARVVQRL